MPGLQSLAFKYDFFLMATIDSNVIHRRMPIHIPAINPFPMQTSSAGGSSERIFLYYAEVRIADKVAAGGGDPAEGEDIQVKEIPLDDLLQRIRQQRVEDPKLLIGGLWLGEELKGDARSILGYSSVRYELIAQPRRFIGYKTGPIEGVRGVDLWVNSENEDMIMDRFIGRSISANIRYLGADKDAAGNLTDDIINNDLTAEIGAHSPVRIGSVFETTSGLLNETHGVDAILHVASVRGAGPAGASRPTSMIWRIACATC